MFRLLLAPVRVPAKAVRGIAWSRAAFGTRRPRTVVMRHTVVQQRTVIVYRTVVIPRRPDVP